MVIDAINYDGGVDDDYDDNNICLYFDDIKEWWHNDWSILYVQFEDLYIIYKRKNEKIYYCKQTF